MNNLITSYTKFMNENFNNEETIYRNTDEIWLKEFLKKEYIEDDFISFSEDYYSGDMDDFGDVNIQFNKEELEKQGLIEIFYEEEFFEENPDICRYVTGFESKKDYYKNLGFDNEKEAIESPNPEAIPWDSYLEDFMQEGEFIIKDKLTYTENLIKHVHFENEPDSKTIELLKNNNITYTIND